jgi:regulator of protease activity HflC (stomatin/prohibitin superfamily)
VRYKVSIQEIQLPPDPINAITHDNVSISVQLAILYRITDASRTMYRIENLTLAIKTIVNGTIRSVIGKTDLDGVQSNRRHLAQEIEAELQMVSDEWGIKLTRVEITEVDVDSATKEAMQVQLNAERKRRGQVTEAEGIKQATQLQADARLYSAEKEAAAKRILADAEAYAVTAVSKAIAEGGASAVEFEIKKIQAAAIQELSNMEIYQISIVVAIALAITELLTLTFIFLGMSGAMLCVAVIQYFTGTFSWPREVIVFVVASVAVTVIFRKIYRNKTDQTRLKADDINQY